MSKFFRANSSDSESSDSGSEEEPSGGESEDSAREVDMGFFNGNATLENVKSQANEATGSSESITIERDASSISALGKDLLIHSLLEERCLNQARNEFSGCTEREIRLEAQRRYQSLCQHLAPFELVSVGLDHGRHSANRQWVRDQLDSIPLAGVPSQALQRTQTSPTPFSPLPGPLRRMLTAGDGDPSTPTRLSGTVPGSPISVFNGAAELRPRYLSDYEQIGVLGKGGYGEVFQVKHRVDNGDYAVKRVPIRPSMIQRVQEEGESALDELLAEARALSKLSHPNIARYNNSWIEWSTKGDHQPQPGSSEVATRYMDSSQDAVLGATASASLESIHRIKTESDTNTNGNIGISFESHSPTSGLGHSETFATSGSGGQLILPGPSLALYLQMAVYPMTLADFLLPKSTAGPAKPLFHCFHFEPSMRVLLAILDGVEYMHSKSLVHRDLKPANVFLKHEENPKTDPNCVRLSSCPDCQAEGEVEPVNLSVCIGDFGLVTNIARADDSLSSPTAAVGTEIYRPTAGNAQVSPRLDIFAVGIIACELLCSFDTQMERRQTLHDIKHGKFPKHFASCAGQYANKVKESIKAMLSHSAEGVSIAELKQQLSSMLAPTPQSPTLLLSKEAAIRRSST